MGLSQEQVGNIYRQIGQNVAKIRKEKQYSQLRLSLEMGHNSVSLISFAEIGLNGKHFNIEHLVQIAYILDVDVCRFFDGVKVEQS